MPAAQEPPLEPPALLRSIDDSHEWDAEPGYRTRELTNDEAWDAMKDAANRMVCEALAARHSLLKLGFAVDHSLCRDLDDTARHYDVVFHAVRHQRYQYRPG